jgi:hypothetical protein
MARNPDQPPLTVVAPTATGISPPRRLNRHGLALWNAIMSEYRIEDRGGIELLAQACAAQDRVEALKARIDAEGETILTRAGPRAHPALRDELQLRAFICRTLERLGLNVEVVKPVGRPAGFTSWVPPRDAYEPDED